MKKSNRRLRPAPPEMTDPRAMKLRRRLKRGAPPTEAELRAFAEDEAELIDALRAVLVSEWVLPDSEPLLERAAKAMVLVSAERAAPLLTALRVQADGGEAADSALDEQIVACGEHGREAVLRLLRERGDELGVAQRLAVPLAVLHRERPDPRTLPCIFALWERDARFGTLAALLSRDPVLVERAVSALLAVPISPETPDHQLIDLVQHVAFMRSIEAEVPAELALRAHIAEAVLSEREDGVEV